MISDVKEKMKEAMHMTVDPPVAAGVHSKGRPIVTTSFGQPAGDASKSLNIRGHVVSSDYVLFEKQQTFNRAKIVERQVHACGSGAFGYFEVTKDVSHLTKAKFLNKVGKRTPMFARFSTVTYGKEFPDSGRNPRGFALKFYTEDGNYDLVGLNWPIFFVRDGALGPDVIRSQQRNPANFLINYDAMFDFWSLVPESLHAALMFLSDHGTPVGWRFMDGYGAHTFKWINEEGKATYIKYHFLSENGVKNFQWDEAVKMCGEDPDFAKRDLWDHIHKGGQAIWKAFVQIMTPEQAANYQFDPFDVTKVWDKENYPLHEFGRMVLDRNPNNYHRDVEQAAFSPGSLVPGIEPSPDALLQWRMFLYRDTQFYRLGVNLHQIPVNAPLNATAYHPFARDGLLRTDENGADEPAYFPNSRGPQMDLSYNWKPEILTGQLSRAPASKDVGTDNEYIQPRRLYKDVMSEKDRQNLHYNIVCMLKFVAKDICLRFLNQCYRIDPDLARGITADLKTVTFADVEKEAQNFSVDVLNGYKYVKTSDLKMSSMPTNTATQGVTAAVNI